MLLYAIFMLSLLHLRLGISVAEKLTKMECSRRFIADGLTIVRMRNALRKNFRRRPKQIKHKMVLQLGINWIRNGNDEENRQKRIYMNKEKKPIERNAHNIKTCTHCDNTHKWCLCFIFMVRARNMISFRQHKFTHSAKVNATTVTVFIVIGGGGGNKNKNGGCLFVCVYWFDPSFVVIKTFSRGTMKRIGRKIDNFSENTHYTVVLIIFARFKRKDILVWILYRMHFHV